eukprot:scaffold620841_cov28-Prasinocladus_malaysianus.AAC.1
MIRTHMLFQLHFDHSLRHALHFMVASGCQQATKSDICQTPKLKMAHIANVQDWQAGQHGQED